MSELADYVCKLEADNERIYNETAILKQQRDALLEAMGVISRMSLSEMREYCIVHKIHEGIGDYNAAMLSQRIAQATIKQAEKEG